MLKYLYIGLGVTQGISLEPFVARSIPPPPPMAIPLQLLTLYSSDVDPPEALSDEDMSIMSLTQAETVFSCSASSYDSINAFNKGDVNSLSTAQVSSSDQFQSLATADAEADKKKCCNNLPPCSVELCIPDIHVNICKVPDIIIR